MPPPSTNRVKELEISLDKTLSKYDNVLIMGDINIEQDESSKPGFSLQKSFMDTYNLKNLIKNKTCFTKSHESSIDVMFTNKPMSFHNSITFETGLSDHHHMIGTLIKTHLVRLKPKRIEYRSYKKFSEVEFLEDLKNADFNFLENDPDFNYESLVNKFSELVNKHAPLKFKNLRGNQAPFMNKEFQKAIYERSRLKNIFNKNGSNENWLKYKKQRNKCVSLRKKAIKKHFNEITKNGIVESKDFWNTVKPFITNKSGLTNSDIAIIYNNEIITDENKLTEIFNEEYINVVERFTGNKPEVLSGRVSNDINSLISEIVDKYHNHPSILKIKEIGDDRQISFVFHEINENDISKLFDVLKSKISAGEDKIPVKLVKLAKPFLVKPLTKAINSSIREHIFPTRAKIAAVSPLDKGGKDKMTVGNYRPVSVLNVFSKFYERIIKSQIVSFLDQKLSQFLSAYRQSYGTQHVLIRLIEEFKKNLDNDYVVGAILMDLSKAFDCVPHDLLLAKLSAYGFSNEALGYIMSYLTERKQATRLNNVYSTFQLILSGVPQGSILGPILFNIFLNDFIYFIETANVHNYADDNTLTSISNSVSNLIKILETETNVAMSWLKKNKMIANPKKFQSIIISKDKIGNSGLEIKINDKIIKSESSVKLLGIVIDEKLNFDKHITELCKKASAQLNALFRLNFVLTKKAKNILIQSFIFSNFNYCPLVWHFSSSKSIQKIECIQKRALRFLLDDNDSSYEELLVNTNNHFVSVKRLKVLCTEIYKTLKNLNPPYMRDIFQFVENNRPVRSYNLNNLSFPKKRSHRFGTNSLTALGPKIWNNLPAHMKASENLEIFKKMMKKWNGINCCCEVCKKF